MGKPLLPGLALGSLALSAPGPARPVHGHGRVRVLGFSDSRAPECLRITALVLGRHPLSPEWVNSGLTKLARADQPRRRGWLARRRLAWVPPACGTSPPSRYSRPRMGRSAPTAAGETLAGWLPSRITGPVVVVAGPVVVGAALVVGPVVIGCSSDTDVEDWRHRRFLGAVPGAGRTGRLSRPDQARTIASLGRFGTQLRSATDGDLTRDAARPSCTVCRLTNLRKATQGWLPACRSGGSAAAAGVVGAAPPGVCPAGLWNLPAQQVQQTQDGHERTDGRGRDACWLAAVQGR